MRSAPGRVVLTLLIALPMAAIAIGTAFHKLDQLNDPCAAWDVGSSGSGYIHPGDPCSQRSGYGETKEQAYLMLAGVQGVILLAGILAVWGAAASPKLMLLAGVLMILEAPPLLFSIGPLALLTGAGLICVGIRLPDRRKFAG